MLRGVARGTSRAVHPAVLRFQVGALALLIPTVVQAQPAPEPPSDDAGALHLARQTITLRQALDHARVHQPSIAAARARVDVARANAQIPRAAWHPRLTAAVELLGGTANNTTASYATVGIIDVARIGGTPANAPVSWQPEVSSLAGVAVHQELFDFGRIDAQADALDALARSQAEVAKVAQLDLDLLVEESFYAVLGAKQVVQASEAAITRGKAHRDLAAAKVRAQLWPPIEQARADADLARFEVDLVRSRGALSAARAVLAASIGSDQPAIDAGTDDVSLAVPPSLDAGMRDAGTRAPELAAARDQLDAQHEQTEAITRELRPDLSLSAELTGRAGGAAVATNPTPSGGGWLPDVPNWDALVVLSWPIYDRTVSARAETSRRLETVRSAELAQVSDQIRTLAARAYVDFQTATAAIPALQRALTTAQANHDQADARFTGGLGTAIELSDAEALLTDAEIQLAIGTFQRSRAHARLARVLGENHR